jgi:AcrR family transcriptional regulator
VVLLSQRARLIEAAIEVVGTRGYAESTVGDIVTAAGVSRSTFYEQFRDKEDCFVAAYEESAHLHFEHVLAATRQATRSIDCLQDGVRAYLAPLADDPAYARASVVEVLTAGSGAAGCRDSVHGRYAALLRDWHERARAENPDVPPMPDEVFDCAVGGVTELVASQVRDGDPEQVSRLAPVIVTFLLNVAAVPAGRELAAALSAARVRSS